MVDASQCFFYELLDRPLTIISLDVKKPYVICKTIIHKLLYLVILVRFSSFLLANGMELRKPALWTLFMYTFHALSLKG
jgi:hypothetical protein